MMALVWGALVLLLSCAPVRCLGRTLSVEVDPSTGAYTVLVDGAAWLASESTGVHVGGTWYLAAPPNASYAQLEWVASSSSQGSDSWGFFEETAIAWRAGTTPVTTTFRSYAATRLLLFEQYFPEGAAGTALGNDYADMNRPVSMFPRFSTTRGRVPELGHYTILRQWRMDMTGVGLDGVTGGLYAGTPLLLYDRDTLASVVISPANQFKAAVQGRPAEFSGDLACGAQGRVRSLPLGFRLQTMVYASPSASVTGAMVEWGDLLLDRYGKARYDPATVDPHRSFLSYYTDTGAYYWYVTELGLNYEQTMLALRDAHQAAGIPVRIYEFDSWWYYKQLRGANSTTSSGGIWLYDAKEDVFPSGMKAVRAQLGTPLIVHAKYFSSTTVYADRYAFLVDTNDDAAVPLSADAWDEIMANAVDWGVTMLKQDWLESVYEFLEGASWDTTTARNYLLYLGGAVARAGITVQYCMPLVGDIVASVESAAAKSIRISGDYSVDPQQWRVGQNAIYAWALGLAPFKDVFWTQPYMPNSRYGDFWEPNPEMQAAVSVLTTAGVGFGDKLGYTNASLLARTCAADGTLLGPAKPATVIDAWFRRQGGPEGGEVWHTYVALPVAAVGAPGAGPVQPPAVVHYVFAVNLTAPYAFQTADAYLAPGVVAAGANGPGARYWGFDVNAPPAEAGDAPALRAFDAATPLVLPACPSVNQSGPYYLYAAAAQLGNGWSLLGETGKFIPVSLQRFASLQVAVNGESPAIAVTVRGAAGERIAVRFASPAGAVFQATCNFPGTPPAWWGAQTTSMDQTLYASCDAAALQCSCEAAPAPVTAPPPSILPDWAILAIAVGGTAVVVLSAVGLIAWARKRAAGDDDNDERSPLVRGSSSVN